MDIVVLQATLVIVGIVEFQDFLGIQVLVGTADLVVTQVFQDTLE